LALPDVVAFDLSIPAQIFGHRDERDRYSFAVCAQEPGPVATSTGFAVHTDDGLEALLSADTIIVPGFLPLADPPPVVLDALTGAADRGVRIASVCVGAFALAAYSWTVCVLLKKSLMSSWAAAMAALVVWFAVAFGVSAALFQLS